MRLICGLDTTGDDPSAAAFARRLSDKLGADLTLAHFVPPSAAFPTEGGVGGEAMRDAVMSAIGDQVGETLARGRGDAEGMIGFGDPAEQLLSLAESEPSAMIVVGSRGRGAAKAAVLGSVSRRVIAGSRCPVTVVPSGAEIEGPGADGRTELDTIVVGYDGSDESRVALRCAAACARSLNASLVLAQATSPPAVVGYLPGVGIAPLPRGAGGDGPAKFRGLDAADELPACLAVEIETLEGHTADGIANLAERVGAGLISVGSRGRGPLGEMLLGSTSSALACAGSRPVMICTREARVPSPTP